MDQGAVADRGPCPDDSRQLRYLDAARRGVRELAVEIAEADADERLWSVRWGTASDLDPRLRMRLEVGPVVAVAWAMCGERPLVAVATSDGGAGGVRLRVWDPASGRSGSVYDGQLSAMSFAQLDDGSTSLLTCHDDGLLRFWRVSGESLCGELQATVNAGRVALVDAEVVTVGDHLQVVTLDVTGRVARWRLPSGERIDVLDAPRSSRICVGTLSDGRTVVVTGGEGVSLWDLASGERMPLEGPFGYGHGVPFRNVAALALSIVGGRDCLTILSAIRDLFTFDLVSGERLSSPIVKHRNQTPEDPDRVWSPAGERPRLAAVAGVLAVPTWWRVHLWDVRTGLRSQPPLAGPAARSVVRAVRWGDRDLLLTGSETDGVVALWDLSVAVERDPEHDGPVTHLAVVEETNSIVSIDDAGTMVVRDIEDGALRAGPVRTGVFGVRAFAAWAEGGEVVAATGAGSPYVYDGVLRWWDPAGGASPSRCVKVDPMVVSRIAMIELSGERVLVTFGRRGALRIWRASDGQLLSEIQTSVRGMASGFVGGYVDGRPVVAVSGGRQPVTLFVLDGSTAPPITVPGSNGEAVLGLVGSNVVTGIVHDERRSACRIIRARDISGDWRGPDVCGSAEMTTVAVAGWPLVYIGRADGRVSLTDLKSGDDRCPPMLLPVAPRSLAVTMAGDLVVGFGHDVALVRAPGRSRPSTVNGLTTV